MSLKYITTLFLIFPLSLFAQSKGTVPPVPSLKFHIQNEFDTLKLPSPQWILQENNQPLSHENLLNKNTADATLIDLKNNPVFSIKAHTNYWFKINLTSEIDSKFGLAMYRNGDCYPYEMTFKNVESFTKNKSGKITLVVCQTIFDKLLFKNLNLSEL